MALPVYDVLPPICVRLVVCALCASVALAAAATPAAGRRAGPVCGPASARTLAQSPRIRVYQVWDTHNRLLFSDYACVSGRLRPMLLARNTSGGPDIGQGDEVAAVNGWFVAIAVEDAGSTDEPGNGAGVGSFNLRHGTHRVLATADGGNCQMGWQGLSAPCVTAVVRSLVVSGRSGAIAWIAGEEEETVDGNFLPGQNVVHRTDRRGTAVLDHSASIHAHSLGLDGSSLMWLHGRTRRHAGLR